MTSNEPKKERLIVTLEIEALPEDSTMLCFSVERPTDFWFSRFKPFRDWKRMTYVRLPITKLDVQPAA